MSEDTDIIKALTAKIHELEVANEELRKTQPKITDSARVSVDPQAPCSLFSKAGGRFYVKTWVIKNSIRSVRFYQARDADTDEIITTSQQKSSAYELPEIWGYKLVGTPILANA